MTVGVPPNRTPIAAGQRAAPEWQRYFSELHSRLIVPNVFYIPSVSGVPAFTPATRTGFVAMTYDTANDDLYVYNGAWKKTTLS